jgi:D-glycero-alpha-D-manno-heptose-7-phosphate kinase
LIKKIDQKIRLLPLLDSSRRLVGLIGRDHLPLMKEGAIYARARAPVRMSFGGGGSDLTNYFSENPSGAVINATISLYSHATLHIRDDEHIVVSSLDLGDTMRASNLEEALVMSDKFGLIQSLIKIVNPSFGFELFLNSDFPIRSGLGGSAAVSASVLGCFNQFRRDKWDLHELAEISYQAERHSLGIAGGWQDQYATVFGGFNFMEFRMDQNVVHPLRIHPDILSELEESLILCDTGIMHDSGTIHRDQSHKLESSKIVKLVERNVELSYVMRNHLLRGRLNQFGESLNQAWLLKRGVSDKVSTSHLDRIYENAKANGAIGGKLLGAGGGGFFLFFVSPNKKHELIRHLRSSNLNVRPFCFESKGLNSWTVREFEERCEEKAYDN